MIKYLSLFSGIGAPEKALKNLDVDYDLVNYCEVDTCASRSYAAIHGVSEGKNLGDITKVDTDRLPKDIDLITYGFPCQDISQAGRQKGLFNADGSHTRSGLFFEALKIIGATKPKVAIAENVKALTSSKFTSQFAIVLQSLEEAGYNNYWQVLNAKDYGVAQNRERVFIVSVRKDIDVFGFEFPEKIPLKKCLRDYLDSEVDEKYYIPPERMKNPRESLHFTQYDGYEISNRVWKDLAPTLTVKGDRTKVYDSDNRIRRLTPKEYFRLMGFNDEDFEKARAVPTTDAQLYKQAGNSIAVNVFEEILWALIEDAILLDAA